MVEYQNGHSWLFSHNFFYFTFLVVFTFYKEFVEGSPITMPDVGYESSTSDDWITVPEESSTAAPIIPLHHEDIATHVCQKSLAHILDFERDATNLADNYTKSVIRDDIARQKLKSVIIPGFTEYVVSSLTGAVTRGEKTEIDIHALTLSAELRLRFILVHLKEALAAERTFHHHYHWRRIVVDVEKLLRLGEDVRLIKIIWLEKMDSDPSEETVDVVQAVKALRERSEMDRKKLNALLFRDIAEFSRTLRTQVLEYIHYVNEHLFVDTFAICLELAKGLKDT